MSCVQVLQRGGGHSGEGCDLASTLCRYDLFYLGLARVQLVRRGSISSKLLMCGCCCLPRLGPSSSQSRFLSSR